MWEAVSSLKRRGSGFRPTGKSESELVTESLLTEVETMIKQHLEEERKERNSDQKSVDYSWLATDQTVRSYDIPPMKKLELESLCSQVKPTDCNQVIIRFREHVSPGMTPGEIVQVMRDLVTDAVNVPVTLPNRRVKSAALERVASLAWLRGPSSKVSPFAMVRRDSNVDVMRTQSVPTLSSRVEDLPV
ncbi:protein RD3-like [Limulus polyphemus]|uniref:Protein RD3-like n=1 Tax=Limulus polyphemus TaxID=6850 RepID=A0ABM1S786_LIMPO|nr:protein RD3-like [Limulus polyphemus]XP_022239491.1 protein RD3-like [Limulus polyphemus]